MPLSKIPFAFCIHFERKTVLQCLKLTIIIHSSCCRNMNTHAHHKTEISMCINLYLNKCTHVQNQRDFLCWGEVVNLHLGWKINYESKLLSLYVHTIASKVILIPMHKNPHLPASHWCKLTTYSTYSSCPNKTMYELVYKITDLLSASTFPC